MGNIRVLAKTEFPINNKRPNFNPVLTAELTTMSSSIQRIIETQDQIIYVENQGMEPYSKIVYPDRSEIVCGNVGRFEKALDSNHFLRINRKTLINKTISTIKNGKAITPAKSFSFSRRKWQKFISENLI